jgi:DNA-binding GntR family transcriptional regulator
MTRKISLTQRAYDQLRDDVLTCRLAPGERINIKEITENLGFSLGAVREALARLTSEGFVTTDDMRGFRAAPISIADLVDLMAVRADIEGQCLRRSIAKGELEWESAIVSAAHRLNGTPMYAPGPDRRLNDSYAAAHAAFHEALVAACDSPWLQRLRTWLYAQSERYRYLTIPFARVERGVTQEHDALVAAVLARDADRAVALLSAHLTATAQILIDREVASAEDAPAHQRAGLRALSSMSPS